MDFKHEIIAFKDRGDKNYVDENVSEHGSFNSINMETCRNETRLL